MVWQDNLIAVVLILAAIVLARYAWGAGRKWLPLAWRRAVGALVDTVRAPHRAVLDSMSDAVIVLDRQRRVRELNLAAADLLVVPPLQAVGKRAAAVLATAPGVIDGLIDVGRTQDEIMIEIDRLACYYDIRVAPLKLRSSEGGYVIVLRENTRRRQAEETIRRYARELEERNQDLDVFTDTVAHDLKAPLHLVVGYTGMLLEETEDSLPPERLEHLREIQRAAQKMTHMIGSLLLLTRLKNVREAAAPVEALSLARAAVSRFRDRIAARRIAVEIAPDLPPALAHASWLEEVFANLIGNAITYIGKDNPSPRIAIRGGREGDLVRYEVEDNGLGIAPEAQARIFDMFSRFHQKEATGMGMGLSIVHRIVTRLDGQVGVISAPGEGSTFWFTLPAPPDQPHSGSSD